MSGLITRMLRKDGSEAIDLEPLIRTDLYADSELTKLQRSGANEFFFTEKLGVCLEICEKHKHTSSP